MTGDHEAEALSTEIESMRAERDRLAAEIDRRRRGGRPRRILAGFLAVLTCVSMFGTTLAYWANRNFLDNDVWVERTGPTIENPAVQTAMSTVLTEQVMTLADPKSLLESALPTRARVLAVPLSGAIENFVHERVTTFVASARFHQMWVALMNDAHRAAVASLRGRSGTYIDTANGTVTIDLVPVIDAILAQITSVSPEIFGRHVTLPKVTIEDLPAAARRKLSAALGVDLSDDYGTLTVYNSKSLSTLQTAIRVFDRLLPLMIGLTIGLAVATLAVSRQRRRSGLQLLVGGALAMVLTRRLMLRAAADILAMIPKPESNAAVSVVIHAFIDPLLAATGWVIVGLAAAVVLLVVTGPYPWMVRLRSGVAATARGAVSVTTRSAGAVSDAAVGLAESTSTADWIGAHAAALQWSGVTLGIIALWFFDLSWPAVVALALVIGAAELLVYRIAENAESLTVDQ
ncbi:MAG: hypothetical protein JST73_11220 [Actinobacteria bacterium]|nr:hypothetical protein [Actinomycetota bacterium]